MSITLIGVIVLLAGAIILFAADMKAMLAFVMVATMFGGSAAVSLGAAGQASSIPPASLALLFVGLRAVLPGEAQMASLGAALRGNILLMIFVAYGVVGAFILPRIFANMGEVTPLHPGAVRTLTEVAPIRFSAQNITTAIYLLGTLASGIGSYIGAAKPGAARMIVTVGIFITILHAMFGFMSVFLDGTPLDAIVEFFRNGNYAILDQSFGDFSRMSGVWPEASGYAGFGGAWLIFMVELWIRDVRPRWTGFAAVLLFAAMLISTSSTAYVTLGGYGLVFMLRSMLMPWTVPPRKAFALGVAVLVALIVALALVALAPAMIDQFTRILTLMTFDKTESSSGRQRSLWVWNALDAFVLSHGFGIGAGTFRSSSLIAAILGSMGVIGAISFAGHLIRAFKPLRPSTYSGVTGDARAVGSAASWTALLMLLPAAAASPTPDPGILWAMFCGFALSLRSAELRPAGSRPAPRPRFANALPELASGGASR